MSKILKTAVVFGATGLVGKELVNMLLDDERYEKVRLFTRRTAGISHLKAEEFIIDFNRIGNYAEQMKANHVFCCLGTTAKKTPDKSEYEKIDFHWPVKIAEICRQNGAESFAVISSVGANEKSYSFYLRTKGRMEKGVLLSGPDKTIIVRPSFLLGERTESRPAEKIAGAFLKIYSAFMVGMLKKYKPVRAGQVAYAMICLSNKACEKSIIENDELPGLK